ncbi:MAG TPA: AMP-binding protein [Gemmatimonadaceae bacterium]|nr:AMP-binding protein [Gemmatimonadaceae bacterium]
MASFPWLAHYDDGVPPTLQPYPERTLSDYLAETARERPQHPTLLFKGATVTAAELERLSDAFGAALVELGVRRGDRVALCLPNCPQFLITQFGAWKAGAVVCPVNPTYTEHELADALSASGAETLVVLTRFYEKAKVAQPRTAVRRVIATSIKEYLPPVLRVAYTLLKEKKQGDRITRRDGDPCLAELLARHRGTRPSAALRGGPGEVATILMSGGTTGTPKGVVGTHRGMTIAGHQLRAWLRSAMREWTDTIMLPLPLFHTYANTGVQSLAMINHNPIALVPNPRELGDVLKEINSVRPAFICAVPTLLSGMMNHSLARAGKVDFRSIKLCFSGAAPLMAETQRRFEALTGGVIVEGYSLTEAQMAVVANPAVGTKKIGSVGMPLPDVEVRILDADDGRTPIAQGEVGEIVIRAPQLMREYWQRPEETREMLRAGPQGEPLLYTGDLGYLDEDGYLFIVDRKKDLIKASGFQVWPREVEEVIAAHPAVAEVGVAGIPDAAKGEVVKAWVVLRPGSTATAGELGTWCRERLVAYKAPSQYEFVSELPKSQIGKVLRRLLRQQEMAKRAGGEGAARDVAARAP